MRSILPRRSPWAKAGRVAIVVLLAVCATPAVAAEPPALVKARTLYNGADYEGAIQAAADVRRLAEWEDEALLVIARSHLELYRQRSDSSNLVIWWARGNTCTFLSSSACQRRCSIGPSHKVSC